MPHSVWMEMGKHAELVKKAYADFELAKRYGDMKEYMTASILYRKATEKVLRAMVASNKKRTPPKDASIEYLAEQAKLPEGMYNELIGMPDESSELLEEESLLEYDESEQTHKADRAEHDSVVQKHNAVRRLLEYAGAGIA